MEGGYMANEFFAHSASREGTEEWQSLSDHLVGTAARARSFGERIRIPTLAEAAALLHDVGKYSDDFQRYLSDAASLAERKGPRARLGRSVDHKLLGASAATTVDSSPMGVLLGLLIAGHHGGLPDLSAARTEWRGVAAEAVVARLTTDGVVSGLPPSASVADEVAPFADPLATDLLLRMAFSCLVDADGLDTEEHFEPSKATHRGSEFDVHTLLDRLKASQSELIADSKPSRVNELRAEVYASCLSAAEWAPGCFRLTVPTGGGKTLSSLAFALSHAVAHGMDRVIYAIPYTSIIDQTVDVFRKALGDERAVLAHHASAFEPLDGEDPDDGPDWRRLAADNWDAPVVVTTNVQFFESLLGSRPGRSRKVHRIARSVVVLDEVQSLPPLLLDPILDVIRGLSERWGTTFVLCSATQPAICEKDKPGVALPDSLEIVPEYRRHFAELRRVDFESPEEPWGWSRVAEEIRASTQCLAVLNTRKDALALLDELGDPEALHLSTLLTPAHRRRVLEEVRVRLRTDQPCRLVSTQVVEAGVDLDFPMVMRAMAPLDRLIQAAGRCNREGRRDSGRVIVFEPSEGGAPPGEYRAGVELARTALSGGVGVLHDPATSVGFFRELYGTVDLDAKGIQKTRGRLAFRSVDEAFNLIAKDTIPLVIPSDKDTERAPEVAARIDALIDALATGRGISRDGWAVLQQHSVALPRFRVERSEREGIARPLDVRGSVYVWDGEYDQVRGIGDARAESGALIA
jgi:CRISPR-associated endonuclease/helicase Cas3